MGIEHPIIMGSMAWVSNAEMVAAVSNAGALGTLGPNAGATTMTKDVGETGERLRKQIKMIKDFTNKPFAVNFVVGVAGLDKVYSEKCVEVGVEEGVPVGIVSQGSPQVYTDKLKKAGMKVIHVCSTVDHARKAESAGVDAVVASGTDGGGHSGFEQNTTFCLVPQVTSAVKIPVIAGGGVADGRQLIASLAMGAEAVYMGTRFIATRECPAHDNYKKILLAAKDGDTIAIRHGDASVYPPPEGLGNRGFATERRGSLRIVLSDKVRELLNQHSGLVNYDLLMKAYAASSDEWDGLTAAAYLHGKSDKRFYAAGQGVGLFHGEIISCADVIAQFMEQAESALKTFRRFLNETQA